MVQNLSFMTAVSAALVGVTTAFAPPRSATLRPMSRYSTSLTRRLKVTSDPLFMSFDSAGSSVVLDRPDVDRKSPIDKRWGIDADNELSRNEEWQLRIYNDNFNSREFVARCLVQVACLDEERAFLTMMHAHQYGIAVVGEYKYEVAEMYEQELGSNGIKCDVVSADGC